MNSEQNDKGNQSKNNINNNNSDSSKSNNKENNNKTESTNAIATPSPKNASSEHIEESTEGDNNATTIATQTEFVTVPKPITLMGSGLKSTTRPASADVGRLVNLATTSSSMRSGGGGAGSTSTIPTLSQIGRQQSANFRLSYLSDSGAESCDADDQTQLIRAPSLRSHKFIIIPAKPTDNTKSTQTKSKTSQTPSRQAFPTLSASSSLVSMSAPTIQHQKLLQQQQQQSTGQLPALSVASSSGTATANINNPATSATKLLTQSNLNSNNNIPTLAAATMITPPNIATSTDAIHHQQIQNTQQPHMSRLSTAALGVGCGGGGSGVTFTIEDCESENELAAIAAHNVDYPIGLINTPRNLTPTIIQSQGASPVMPSPLLAATPTTHLTSSAISGLRPLGMRTVMSAAHISSPMEPAVQQPFHSSTHYLQPTPSYADRELSASSYLYRNHSANQIYSDVTSVRSLASIALGSTDGKKLVIRRVPNTATELFSLVHPPSPPPPGIDDFDDDSILDVSDETANLKPRQQHWGNKMQFVLACIGYSVGLGNVWRFPYMCYKSGGGVFLVPYCIILFICSIPLLFMELSIGQYSGRGPIGALGQLCPLFKGAGLASVVVSFLMSTYYSVIIGYSIYYFFTAFRTDMPWVDCNNRWNTPDCWVPQPNLTAPNTSRTPSEEFFEKKVLQISRGIEYPGMMRWELFACLICAWLMVYFATWKSIKSSAKVRYFTATFPFILILILLGRAVTLEGAHEGLRYFFRPDWQELKNANVWINAASQNFNSLGISFGSMISFASYNKYNNNILHDTIAVSVVNILTSLLVGIFAFATLGNLALEQNTHVKDVIGDGPGLIFVIYPQAMAKMPYAQLWAVMFFFMLLCLGLNSQFAIVEVVVTSIQDGFPNWIKRHLGYHEIVVLIVCIVSFGFGLPNLIQGGIYFFQLMDHYAASVTIMFLAFCQMIAIAWFYGTGRLSQNIKQMTGKAPSIYLKSCWILLGPCLLFAIWILSLVNYKEPTYHNGRYVYPDWAYGIGWMFASFSLICIPGYAVINLLRASGNTFWERVRNTLRPNIYECRICGEHHCEHDFSEQEQFMLAQELASGSVYKPTTQLKSFEAGKSSSPATRYSPLQKQQQQHQQQPPFKPNEYTYIPNEAEEDQSPQTTATTTTTTTK